MYDNYTKIILNTKIEIFGNTCGRRIVGEDDRPNQLAWLKRQYLCLFVTGNLSRL